jgi:hypothetical protein
MILNGSAHVSCVFEFEKNNKQSLKIDPGTQKKTGNVKRNKTITALHFVQYDVLWSTFGLGQYCFSVLLSVLHNTSYCTQ